MIRKWYLFPAAAVLFLAAVLPAHAAVFIPTKLTDSADGACDSDCSLREAVLAANAADGPDFIVLGAGTYEVNLPGRGEDLAATGDLDIRDDLAIVGRGASNTYLNAFVVDRAFDVLAGVRLEIVGITIANGHAGEEAGGGIRVAGELDLTRGVVWFGVAGEGAGIAGIGGDSLLNIDQSSILSNFSTGQGGGIYAEGTLNLINSTLAGNIASLLGGGGLYAHEDAVGSVSNSTIAFNEARAGKGGGVFVASEPFISIDHPVFENTIIAANTAPSEKDCSGAANSAGHNLLGDGSGCLDFGGHPGDIEGTAGAPLDPKLLPLEATGGPTPVHRPNTGSPAIDHGSGCEPVDQRGAARSASACEIGAVEVTGQCISGGPALCLNQNRFEVKVTWTTPQGDTGSGQATQLTDESGYFTFFDPSNVELTVKVLNACSFVPSQRYWVFMSGLTNVKVQVTVTDTRNGTVKTYNNPLNQSFAPILDTNAFATCP